MKRPVGDASDIAGNVVCEQRASSTDIWLTGRATPSLIEGATGDGSANTDSSGRKNGRSPAAAISSKVCVVLESATSVKGDAFGLTDDAPTMYVTPYMPEHFSKYSVHAHKQST